MFQKIQLKFLNKTIAQSSTNLLARRVRSPVTLQVAHQNLLQVVPEGTFLGDLRLNLGHVLLQLADRDEQLAQRRGHVVALQTFK